MRETGLFRELGQFGGVELFAVCAFDGFDPLTLASRQCLVFGGLYLMSSQFGRRRHRDLTLEFCGTEKGLELIVIALGKRLGLVIVATRASQRLAQEYQRGGIRHVIQRVMPTLDLVGRIHHIRTQQIETGSNQSVRVVRK